MTPEERDEARKKELEDARMGLEKAKKLLNELTATKPKYSPETIRRYRQMEKEGAFKRQIRERTPFDPECDEATLECGHKVRVTAALLDASSGKLSCSDCGREWLQKAETTPEGE